MIYLIEDVWWDGNEVVIKGFDSFKLSRSSKKKELEDWILK